MSPYAGQEKLLSHIFQESLTGEVAKWYYQLEKGHIHTWRDLVREFLKQHQHLLRAAADRFTLQNMRKSLDESYKEYAIQWKGVSSQVQPPLTHKEINSLFVDTLSSPYYDKLVGNAFPEFGDLMYSVGRIEDGIQSGRIKGVKASFMDEMNSRAIAMEEKYDRNFDAKNNDHNHDIFHLLQDTHWFHLSIQVTPHPMQTIGFNCHMM